MVRRKLRMGAKTVGSLSMKMAPVSSFSVEIRPLRRLEKKESGIQVRVWREVLNLCGDRERTRDDGERMANEALIPGPGEFPSLLQHPSGSRASSRGRSNP